MMSESQNKLGLIELARVSDPIKLCCPACQTALAAVTSKAVKKINSELEDFYFFSGRDVSQSIHDAMWDWMKTTGQDCPYTLHADGLSGSCQSCGVSLYGVSFGFVDAAVSELFDDRYFDNNCPALPAPVMYLGKLLDRKDLLMPFPWWVVRKYQTDIGDVFHHTLGVWTDKDWLLETNPFDRTAEIVKAILPELFTLAVDARRRSLHKRVCSWTKKTSGLIT
jgi:hypothetical protein